MAYVSPNFPSKAALRRALAAGETVTVFQPGGVFLAATDGVVAVEGPHFPKPHSWYGSVVVKDGIVLKLKA